MSVTFRVHGLEEEHGYDLPCPTCGLSIEAVIERESRGIPRPFDCACQGYGGPPTEDLPSPRYELNVANGNADALLRWLDLEGENACDGAVLLCRLAIKRPSAGLLVQAVERGARWTEHGRTPEQVARYVEALERIASRAAKWDTVVEWS